MKIFCLENRWSTRPRDKSSVRPMLQLLHEVSRIDFVHETVTVEPALEEAGKRWRQKQYDDYGIGYFAFHGLPGKLDLGRRKITLEVLAEYLGPCRRKVIHLSGCSILDTRGAGLKRQLEDFAKATGARAVCGYKKDVDWVPAAAFDMVLLQNLVDHRHEKRWEAAAAIKKTERDLAPLAKDLAFDYVPRR